MKIIQIDLANSHQVRAFLALPFHIYRDIPQWVPPFESDARQTLDARRNPFFQHSEAAFFLVEKAGRFVGRLAVLNNRRYNDYNHEKTAFFSLFECENDPGAARALFDAAQEWALAHRLTTIQGPKGFSVFDGLGLLVRGFEHRPAFGIPYNPSYYATLLEACGFQTIGEIVSGYLCPTAPFPEKIHRASEIIQKRRGLRVVNFRSRRELRSLIPQLKDLYNGALTGSHGNVPITDAEAKTMADQLIRFADPRLIKIIYNQTNEAVGFLFAYPDISAAVQRTRGRLFPFGWVDLLFEMRRTPWVNINGAGILEAYRGLGGTAILFSEMGKSVVERGFQHADLVQIGLENDKMQRELRDLGIEFYKSHRMYQKLLPKKD